MSETAAAHVNFGPAWLRESLNSETSGPGFVPQPLSKSTSMPSGYNAFLSGSGLATAKLADHRYGREEMLALFSYDHCSPLQHQVSVMTAAGIFIEKAQYPINLMGTMSEEEQRTWQRGANSESSLKLYKKDSGGIHHTPGVGKGLPSERGGRGAGRGGTRGGTGNSFFDRLRASPEEDGEGTAGPVTGVGRGRGTEEGGRSFGRGSARGFERSISERSGWFERSHSTTEETNGGNVSPRKGYTRAPYDDWRKPPGSGQEGEEEGGPTWRGGGSTASGRRWNAPHGPERGGGAAPGTGEGRGSAWRSDREFVNGNPKEWRDDYPERGSGRRGYHSGSKYGSRGGRHTSGDNLPGWANEESSPNEKGGSFDASGKFQAIPTEKSYPKKSPGNQSDSDRTDSRDESGLQPPDEDSSYDETPPPSDDEEVDVDDLPYMHPRRVALRNKEYEIQRALREKEEEIIKKEKKKIVAEILSKRDPDEPISYSNGLAIGMQVKDELKINLGKCDWFYLDPQGKTQGPFKASDMLDWFNAGYFPQDLMLRRCVDRAFIQLSEMTKLYGRSPFTPGEGPKVIWDNGEKPDPVVPQVTQVSSKDEDKQRQEQQSLFINQLQQQLVAQQQLMQQHQLYVIQQQQQGASPASLAFATQQLAEVQKHHQQILEKLMQLTLLQQQAGTQQITPQTQPQPQQQHMLSSKEFSQTQPQPAQPQQQHMLSSKEFSTSPSPLDFVSIAPQSPLEGLRSSHQQQQQQQLHHLQHLHTSATSQYDLPKGPEPVPHQQQGLDFGGNSNSGVGYDPIKSLLTQLHESTNDFPQRTPASSTYSAFGGLQQNSRPNSGQPQPILNDFIETGHRSIWDLPVPGLREEEPVHQQPMAPTNVWVSERSASPQNDLYQTTEAMQRLKLQEQEAIRQQQLQQQLREQQLREQQQQQLLEQQLRQQLHRQQQAAQEEDVVSNGGDDLEDDGNDEFMKPKANEKGDKKVKRAEEKRKQKEAKKAAQAAQDAYIPGAARPPEMMLMMSSSAQDELEDDWEEEVARRQKAQIEAQMEAQQKLQEDQRKIQEKQQQAQQQQSPQVKLAPWAKKADQAGSRDLSLAEIQRLEEERDREARLRREAEEIELRARQEAEAEMMRRQATKNLNWATAASSNGNGHSGHTKSLAEIQAEEERQERERQEKEKKEKKARQKEMGLAQASVWGSANANLSWAGRITANATPPAANQNANNQKSSKPGQQPVPAWQQVQQGFWDEPTPQQVQSRGPQPKAQPQQQQSKNNSRSKKVKEETKVAAIFRDKQKPSNEFETWCVDALEKLNAEVDIPTFMAFLNDIESPYDVSDYVKNYIGEGKSHKNFAKEYLERRSQWKNSMKARRDFEDDLLTPAVAINPVVPDYSDGVAGIGAGAGGGGAKASGSKSKKKGGKLKGKTDVSHLLGFSVAPGERVNAGELDLPN